MQQPPEEHNQPQLSPSSPLTPDSLPTQKFVCETSKTEIFIGLKNPSKGTKEGPGLLITNNNQTVIEGIFKNDQINGIGFQTTKPSRNYIGQFKNGKKHGIGRLKNKKMNFIGIFENGRRNGVGIIKGTKKKKIKGYFKEGVLDGWVFIQDENKKYSYRGEIKNGIFDGIGEEILAGSLYFGRFVKGFKNGIGILKNEKEGSFLGHWKKGNREGFGVEHFRNCDVYFGDYQDGERTGIGKYVFSDQGFWYLGEFRAGERYGFGRLESRGMYYVGMWRKGRREGLGYQEMGDGKIFFGEFSGDRRQGIGVEVTTDVRYAGEWFEDKPHGRGILKIFSKNVERKVFFKNGKMSHFIENFEDENFESTLMSLSFESTFEIFNKKILDYNRYIERNVTYVKEIYNSTEFDIYTIEKKINFSLGEIFQKVEEIVIEVRNVRKDFLTMCKQLPGHLLDSVQSAFDFINREGLGIEKRELSSSEKEKSEKRVIEKHVEETEKELDETSQNSIKGLNFKDIRKSRELSEFERFGNTCKKLGKKENIFDRRKSSTVSRYVYQDMDIYNLHWNDNSIKFTPQKKIDVKYLSLKSSFIKSPEILRKKAETPVREFFLEKNPEGKNSIDKEKILQIKQGYKKALDTVFDEQDEGNEDEEKNLFRITVSTLENKNGNEELSDKSIEEEESENVRAKNLYPDLENQDTAYLFEVNPRQMSISSNDEDSKESSKEENKYNFLQKRKEKLNEIPHVRFDEPIQIKDHSNKKSYDIEEFDDFEKTVEIPKLSGLDRLQRYPQRHYSPPEPRSSSTEEIDGEIAYKRYQRKKRKSPKKRKKKKQESRWKTSLRNSDVKKRKKSKSPIFIRSRKNSKNLIHQRQNSRMKLRSMNMKEPRKNSLHHNIGNMPEHELKKFKRRKKKKQINPKTKTKKKLKRKSAKKNLKKKKKSKKQTSKNNKQSLFDLNMEADPIPNPVYITPVKERGRISPISTLSPNKESSLYPLGRTPIPKKYSIEKKEKYKTPDYQDDVNLYTKKMDSEGEFEEFDPNLQSPDFSMGEVDFQIPFKIGGESPDNQNLLDEEEEQISLSKKKNETPDKKEEEDNTPPEEEEKTNEENKKKKDIVDDELKYKSNQAIGIKNENDEVKKDSEEDEKKLDQKKVPEKPKEEEYSSNKSQKKKKKKKKKKKTILQKIDKATLKSILEKNKKNKKKGDGGKVSEDFKQIIRRALIKDNPKLKNEAFKLNLVKKGGKKDDEKKGADNSDLKTIEENPQENSYKTVSNRIDADKASSLSDNKVKVNILKIIQKENFQNFDERKNKKYDNFEKDLNEIRQNIGKGVLGELNMNSNMEIKSGKFRKKKKVNRDIFDNDLNFSRSSSNESRFETETKQMEEISTNSVTKNSENNSLNYHIQEQIRHENDFNDSIAELTNMIQSAKSARRRSEISPYISRYRNVQFKKGFEELKGKVKGYDEERK